MYPEFTLLWTSSQCTRSQFIFQKPITLHINPSLFLLAFLLDWLFVVLKESKIVCQAVVWLTMDFFSEILLHGILSLSALCICRNVLTLAFCSALFRHTLQFVLLDQTGHIQHTVMSPTNNSSFSGKDFLILFPRH